MKIITDTKRYGKLCYVQVRDVLFLAKMTNNQRLMKDYVRFINEGKTDYEFIKVSGDSYIRAFELCDYIIDFSEYSKKDIGINYLSNMVKSKVYVSSRDSFYEEGINHQIESVRDMIAFKKGELDYKILLVADGRVEILSKDRKFTFESTVVDDCFILKTTDGSNIECHDYQEFLEDSVKKIFEKLYSDYLDKTYGSFVTGNTLVININRGQVQNKKSVVGRILAKIKKEK